MAKKFQVTAPDGHTLEVNGPDDATEEQAIQQAQKLYQPPQQGQGNRGLSEFITSPHGFLREGARQIGQGATEFAKGALGQPGASKARGVNQMLGGAGSVAAPFAIGATIPAALAAPIPTAAALGTGALGSMAGGALARGGARLAGAEPETQELAGTLGGLGGGLAGGVGGALGSRSLGTKTAEGLANSALGTTARTRQFGMNPGRATLQETSGFRPGKIAESARQRIGELAPIKEAHLEQAPDIPLTPSREALGRHLSLATQEGTPTIYNEVEPMLESLHKNPVTQQPYPEQVPARQGLDILRGFGKEHTRFVEGRTGEANEAAKSGWGTLRDTIRSAAPETQAIDERMANLIPARDLAVKAQHAPGPVETGVGRLTRPTGGLIPLVAGFHAGGPLGGAAVMAGQEALSSPAVKMALARALYRGVAGKKLAIPNMPPIRVTGE